MSEWKFKRDTAFRKQFFVPDSFAHPAKMDAQLLIKIVEEYTKPGEVILDPMAGSGTTMLACTLGRNCILVELEKKFCGMCKSNWQRVSAMPQLGYQMGECNILQGGARQLGDLLVDKIVTSPPFAESVHHTDDPKYSEKYRPGRSHHLAGTAGDSEGNIGHLPYGEIDKCIFSPPYAEDFQRKQKLELETLPNTFTKHLGQFSQRQHPCPDVSSSNISALPYGQIDKIVTSPPYEEAMGVKHHSPRADKLASEKSNPVTYTDRIDGIITSPPYELTAKDRTGGICGRDKTMKQLSYYGGKGNIGNLKSDSYLQAMLQVYQQCHQVLKPSGLMILVTKNFIRNKQVVRLDTDTIYLCEQAGFLYLERHYRELLAQSFWRTIYHQKYPEVEQVRYEDILVFKKLT